MTFDNPLNSCVTSVLPGMNECIDAKDLYGGAINFAIPNENLSYDFEEKV